MSPEMMITVVCLLSGLLLLVGGFLFGHAGGSPRAEASHDASSAELDFKIEQAQLAAAELRKQMESERSSYEMKIASAKLERDRYSSELERALKDTKSPGASDGASSKELDELRARADKAEAAQDELRERAMKAEAARAELEAKAKDLEDKIRRSRPSIPSLEMERDIKQARDEVDRLRKELTTQDSRISGLQANLEKANAELENVTKERDEARDRKDAADRIIEAVRARSTGVQQQLKEAQAELAKLKG